MPALPPLPRWPLQPLFRLATRHLVRRHPAVFERLRPLGRTIIAIDVTDLGLRFELQPNAAGDPLRLLELGDAGSATATISGPLVPLLALLQGKCDGDALFFSRVLAVEGDIATVVALRNALDNAEIDLPADIAAVCGPARGMVERLMREVERRYFSLQQQA